MGHFLEERARKTRKSVSMITRRFTGADSSQCSNEKTDVLEADGAHKNKLSTDARVLARKRPLRIGNEPLWRNG